ncbi:unnamed protein product [Prunus armeniaca]
MSSDKSNVSLIHFNGKNYSAWAFHFGIFIKGKEAWGHVDGSNPAPDKNKVKDQHAKWEVKDAQVMTWILGSVEPNIILNLRSSQTAAQMWTYLKKIYSQQNTARWFQLEHELAAFQQDSLSISDFYSRFTNLWAEYTDIVYADLPSEGLSSVQSIHETTQRDQFLMKLRPEFEGTRSNLMNRESVPSLDTCLNDLLCEEQRLLTQTTMEQRRSASVPVAYAAQGKPRGRDMSTVHDGHIIKECPTRPPKKSETAYTVSVGFSSAGSSVTTVPLTQSAHAPVQPVTPDMIQQMIISAFSALGLSAKPFFTSSPWYFDSGASHHMTNNADSLTNVNKYFGNLKIHTTDGNHLPITATGDVSPSLTDVFVSPGLTTNLVSVGQLVDNDCKVEFSKSGCVVQDQQSGRMITRGPKVGRLFPLQFPLSSFSPFVSCNSAHVDYRAWHKRLGHPNSNVLHDLWKSGFLGNKESPSLSAVQFDCNSCKLGKRLPTDSRHHLSTVLSFNTSTKWGG